MLMSMWRLLNKLFSTLQSLQDGQKVIQSQLAHVLDILTPGPAVQLIFTAQLEDGTTLEVSNNMALTLRDDQKATLSIAPVDAKGKPAALDGVPVWAGSDDTVFTVVAAADGLSAVLVAVAPNANDATGAPVPARVVVTADADLGSGVTPLTGTLDVVVTGGQATTLTINAAPPASQ